MKLAAAAGIGAAASLSLSYLLAQKTASTAVAKSAALPAATFAPEELAQVAAPVSGTMLLCVQNLAVSGANQVLLNLVEGCVWKGNIVLVSPSLGPFAKEFSALGVAVRIGVLGDLLRHVRDVRVAICNTIMTAHNVLECQANGIPAMWILHE